VRLFYLVATGAACIEAGMKGSCVEGAGSSWRCRRKV
jgi:hypothetical protein